MKMHEAHKVALQAIDLLMDVEVEGPEANLFSGLAEVVEKYEKSALEWDDVNGQFGVGS